ncbi:MAG: hypothetical protein JNN15_00705 [Blastocatellia bacterium]|nr:hypothetical protein [Blastocatellia bacterium]
MKVTRRVVLSQIIPSAMIAAAIPTTVLAEDQPRMRAALDALKLAQRELEAATSDKGGHRAKAIKLVKQAIVETERGIRFDNRR